MKANGLLKWLLIPVLLLGVWAVIELSSHHATTSAPPQGATPSALTPAEMADLGIPADTPRDTVATLVAQVQHLQSELETSVHASQAQKAENDTLRGQLVHLDGQLQAALHSEDDHWQHESEQAATDATAQAEASKRIADLAQKIDALTGKASDADLPVGLGLRPGDDLEFGSAVGSASPAVHWVDPLALPAGTKASPPQSTAAPKPFQLSSGFDTGESDDNAAGSNSGSQPQKQSLTEKLALSSVPVYTLPANSTLMGSVAMTALIGRIPVDGTVNDPYPFKVLVGPENLTANGIDLPNVAGAVMSGTASGDWTLSCVRGRITSITFVFRDETVRTVSAAGAAGQGEIGWISDPYGIPCVSGVRRSNAKQYLGSQMLITAAGAGAASLIRNQAASYSYVAGSNGSTLGTVGISGDEAMGRILAGGVEAMSQWVNKLYGQAFAAIYVAPGARVAVHIVKSIDIDYDPHGRRVSYEGATSRASDLD